MTKFIVRLATIVIALAFLAPGLAMAQQAVPKQLYLRSADDSLQISFEPVKAAFDVGEPVRFNVRGNRDFFLYLFSIDTENDQALLLIPNARHGNKYPGNQTLVVPNPDVQFAADRPGTEKLVVVAATRYMDLDQAFAHKSGSFSATTAREAQYQVKALHLRPAAQKQQQIVQELDVPIVGAAAVPAPGVDQPIVFVSCERDTYQLGQPVRIVFGADRRGWVSLFALNTQGRYDLLKTQAVDGDRIYRLTARADRPTGKQALVAVYSAEAGRAAQAPPPVDGYGAAVKGLTLDTDRPPHALFSFSVK